MKSRKETRTRSAQRADHNQAQTRLHSPAQQHFILSTSDVSIDGRYPFAISFAFWKPNLSEGNSRPPLYFELNTWELQQNLAFFSRSAQFCHGESVTGVESATSFHLPTAPENLGPRHRHYHLPFFYFWQVRFCQVLCTAPSRIYGSCMAFTHDGRNK